VRGSTPCPCEQNLRYGGNTACVALEVAGEDPIVLDLGTGLRFWGDTQPVDGTFHGAALVTHIHWDHVQGLPFFPPADRPGASFDIYGPALDNGTLADAFDEFMRPPFFPVRARDLRGDYRFHDVSDTDLVIGNAKVLVRSVPHCGPTNGYRVDWDGASVAYVSDHQSPLDGSDRIAQSVLELCDGVDLLIHDAQYTPAEWAEKSHWGHCTTDYAIHVAAEAGAKRLALFHHDPAHDDDAVDRMLDRARDLAAACGLDEVVAAHEGMTVAFDREPALAKRRV
jgi:phosphoribosyl 1,2-cyclic phosphodiesterase